MKMTRFGEPRILAILRQAGGGVPVSELCREHGIVLQMPATYGGVAASMISQMTSREDKNRRLKAMFADPRMQAE